jgi:hypothetical protein
MWSKVQAAVNAYCLCRQIDHTTTTLHICRLLLLLLLLPPLLCCNLNPQHRALLLAAALQAGTFNISASPVLQLQIFLLPGASTNNTTSAH